MTTVRRAKLPVCISVWTVSMLRKQIEKDLEAAGLLEKVAAYTNKVGYSEKSLPNVADRTEIVYAMVPRDATVWQIWHCLR